MMVFVGVLGLSVGIRTRHPGPILIAGMLSAGVFAANVPGIVAKIMALVIFLGFSTAGLYIYQRAQGAL